MTPEDENKINEAVDYFNTLPINEKLEILMITHLSTNKVLNPDKVKQNTNRWLYKENYDTGKYIKVGVITEDNEIELYPPRDKIINTTKLIPNLYSTSWYVEPRGYEGTEQYLGMFSEDLKNVPKEIIVKRDGLVDKVTGYLTDKGKAIYYDQYLNN